MRIRLLILWLWSAAAFASPVQNVTVNTYPPDARLRLNVVSAGHVDLNLGDYFPVNHTVSASADAVFDVRAERPRFATTKMVVDVSQMQNEMNGRAGHRYYPAVGQSQAMVADNPVWGLAVWVRFHPWQTFLGLAVSAGLSGLAFSQWSKRRVLEARRNREQELRGQAREREDQLVKEQRQVGRYRIIDRLGFGGMAVVYLGVPDDTLDMEDRVALKVIREEYANDVEFQKRFIREMNVYRDLRHASIVYLEEAGSEPFHYMAMEFVDGEPLSKRLRKEGLPLNEALGYFLPALEAIAYAHTEGVIHRDIKPENVMITSRGLVKVMDFGLARSHDMSRLTLSGSILGTPAYIAPELVLGASDEVHPSSDQYALGIMLYELLVGRTPFVGADPMVVVMQHVTQPVPPPTQFRPDLNPQIERILLRVLEKEPNQRLPNLNSFADALRLVADGGTWTEPPRPPKPPPRENPLFEVQAIIESGSDDTAPFVRRPSQG